MNQHAIWILSIALLLSLVGHVVTWRIRDNERTRQLLDIGEAKLTIATKQAEILGRDTLIQALQTKVVKDSAKFKVSQNAAIREIKVYKVTIAKLRPLLQAKIDSFPDLREFVAAQDSTIDNQQALIQSQELHCTLQVRSLQQIIALTTQQFEAQKQITAAVTEQLAISTQETRKERRGKKFWRVLAVVGTVGGILLGASQ